MCKVGELRRDPFAMLPFCGYNMADHWAHWLRMGETLRANATVPRIFQVNWFRKGDDGRYLWPGFAENARVLAWILDRVDAQAPARDTPLGLVPRAGGIGREGLEVTEEDWEELFAIDHDAWRDELDGTEQFFATFGDRLPDALPRQLADIRARLDKE